MKPQDFVNGDEGGSGASASGDDSSGSEGGGAGEEGSLSLWDAGHGSRVLGALNALRRARQHYDVVLLGAGGEEPAHRAVLAAAAPRLTLPPDERAHRLPQVAAAELRALVEYLYTGRLVVRNATAARRLYLAACELRLDAVRLHLATRLAARLTPADCLATRALPDLPPHLVQNIDQYVSEHLEEATAAAALPLARLDLLLEPGAARGEEPPLTVADAALVWLRRQFDRDPNINLEELCSRVHMLYVGASGALRDCGELPARAGDAPELRQYRREAGERAAKRRDAPVTLEAGGAIETVGGGVVAARQGTGGVTRAVLCVRGRLVAARVAWRERPTDNAEPARAERGELCAELRESRAAHGAAALGCQLVVCGGYDRARVLRSAEAYDPATNSWTELPEMSVARARFSAAVCGGALLALGGSNGNAELDSVAALRNGTWSVRARLPRPVSHAAAAVDPMADELYLVGGWASGHCLRSVYRYSPRRDAWTDAPQLNTGRSQCAAVVWAGCVWVLGGCDAWHCLASTERLSLEEGEGEWALGPPLPTARRSAGACAWSGALVVAGGSDGAASLRRTDWLAAGSDAWREGPPLRRPRADLGLVGLGSALYAVAGFSGKEFLSCVECLYTQDGQWTALCDPHQSPMPHIAPAMVQGGGKGESVRREE